MHQNQLMFEMSSWIELNTSETFKWLSEMYLYKPLVISRWVFIFSSWLRTSCWWSSSMICSALSKDASASSKVQKLRTSSGFYLHTVLCNTRSPECKGYLSVRREAAPSVRFTLRRHKRTSSFSSLQEEQKGRWSLALVTCSWACSPQPEEKNNNNRVKTYFEFGFLHTKKKKKKIGVYRLRVENCFKFTFEV